MVNEPPPAVGRSHHPAPVYTLELLGESSMVSMRVGGKLVSIKAPKDFRAEIGDAVRAAVHAALCDLISHKTGVRLLA